jgi:hypothetical protein
MSSESARRDLQHFLRLSAAQVRYRLGMLESKETYSVRVARLRMLEELIKEQIPYEDSRRSISQAR